MLSLDFEGGAGMTALMICLRERLMSRFVADDTGATAVEYGLLVALIAAVIVAVVAALGGQLSSIFNSVTNAI